MTSMVRWLVTWARGLVAGREYRLMTVTAVP